MQTYSLSRHGAMALRRRGALRILRELPVVLAAWFVILWATKQAIGMSTSKTLLIALLLGMGFGVAKWLVWTDYVKRYKVLIDDDAICTINRGAAQSFVRGQIRTMWEKKDGLYLSGRTGLLARLGGYVWIPRELPEFGEVRDLAESWKA